MSHSPFDPAPPKPADRNAGESPSNAAAHQAPSDAAAPRPYIGVQFECCGVYARVYRRPDQKEYVGRCPRCLRTVRVRVGPGGTSSRMFRAT